MSNRRSISQISSGSMADISFLLLIFFMVATTIDVDQGILVKLPPVGPDIIQPMNDNNVLSVHLNKDNQLLVEKEVISVDQLRAYTKEFLLNPESKEDLPSSPNKAVVSFQHDRATLYEEYIAVYNELTAAYHEIWNDISETQYGQAYSDDLPIEIRKAIRDQVPMVISEAEPTEF